MRIFGGFTMFFYTVVFLILGCGLIVFSLNAIPLDEIFFALEYAYQTLNVQIIVGLVGLLVIVYSLFAVQLALGNIQREKTIAFENPSGRVTISLNAIEDFIKRISAHLSEIKELRASVTANKKGVHVISRVIIYSDANIPEATEKMQGILKNKIQEMLGIEEPINIKVHIAKIVARNPKESKTAKVEEPEEKKPVFRGIEYGS